ncbi:MAG: hypothetical protein SGJ20_08175 [Planctomycetota bacterium]|nr:hypothetical protein [Planctomycetota bacterium]
MSEDDFTPGERTEIRAMMRKHKAESTVKVAANVPEGSNYCGRVGRFAVYFVNRVFWLVGVLSFQNDVQDAVVNAPAYVEVAFATLDAMAPEPAPPVNYGLYPPENAFSGTSGPPDGETVISTVMVSGSTGSIGPGPTSTSTSISTTSTTTPPPWIRPPGLT